MPGHFRTSKKKKIPEIQLKLESLRNKPLTLGPAIAHWTGRGHSLAIISICPSFIIIIIICYFLIHLGLAFWVPQFFFCRIKRLYPPLDYIFTFSIFIPLIICPVSVKKDLNAQIRLKQILSFSVHGQLIIHHSWCVDFNGNPVNYMGCIYTIILTVM